MFEVKNRIPNPMELMVAEDYLLAKGYTQRVILNAYSFMRNDSYFSNQMYRQGLAETLEDILESGIVE